MTIDWLEAESAIDERLALNARAEKLKAELAADPKNAEVALRLLNTLDQMEAAPQEMAQLCEPAFQANPKDAALMAWLGQLSYRLGQMKLAMVTLKHALALDPNEVLANYSMGQLMMYAGAYDEGLKYGSKAWEGADATWYRREIGRLYCIALARLKRFDDAYMFQQKRLAESPEHTQTVIDTADLLREMNRNIDGVALLRDLYKKKPRDPDLLFRLAVGYFEDENNVEAKVWADKLIDADSQHLECWNLRSQIRAKLGDFKGAMLDHMMIRELSKKTPLDHVFLSDCLVALGRKDEAVATLKQGLEEVSQWPDRVKQYKAALSKLTVQPPEQQAPRNHKLGPNDPCWCGSGKKLKKCHG